MPSCKSNDCKASNDIQDNVHLLKMCWEVETTGDGVWFQSNGLTCSVKVTFSEVITAKYCGAWGGLERPPFSGQQSNESTSPLETLKKKHIDHKRFCTHYVVIWITCGTRMLEMRTNQMKKADCLVLSEHLFRFRINPTLG